MQASASLCDRVIDGHVFLFQGQGSQAIGMGEEVCDVSARTTAVWDCASDVSGIDVRKLCRKGPMNRLMQTRFQQLAVTTVSIAMFERLSELVEIKRPVFVGHSAGEYAALYAAGAFSLDTLFKAIFTRGTLMQEMAEQTDGVMYVVKDINRLKLQQIIEQEGLQEQVCIANDNSPRQVVLSGDSLVVKNLAGQLQQDGLGLVKLPVNGAWHSSLMAPAQTRLREVLEGLPIQTPKSPIYMNLTASVIDDREQIINNLVAHLTQMVRWRETMEHLYLDGYRQFVEIGMKKILGSMLTGHYPMSEQFSVSCFTDWC